MFKISILLCLECHDNNQLSGKSYFRNKFYFSILYIQVHHTMELTLKSNNQESIAKIIALAKKLNVMIEANGSELGDIQKNALKNQILNFKAKETSSFGDAAEWQKKQPEDRDLPLL